MSALQELKRRKIVQWALAYLAGAWVVLQLADILGDQFGWPTVVLRGTTILLGFGFFIALVLAWYHGEKGRQRVSGPELLMLAGILVVAGVAVAFLRAGGGSDPLDPDVASATGVRERSIAVLPLQDHSPGDDHDYFAGAMTEEITSALSRIPELRVTSRSSASQFPESGKTVREFALEDLEVAHVLEGSVQRVEDRVRITVQLIDARTDEHLWSRTYERELGDILDLQVEIAGQVADRLASSLTQRQKDRMRARGTDDPVAYDLYLRALQAPSMSQRTRLLQQMVERDPEAAGGWANLAVSYFARSGAEGPEWADSARMAIDRAIELTEGDASLFRALRTMAFGGDREAAMAGAREALAANPSSETLLRNLALIYGNFEGDLVEGVRLMRRAVGLDPLDPQKRIVLGTWYTTLGLYDRAESTLRRALELDPHSSAWSAWRHLARLRRLQSRYADALSAVDSMTAHFPAVPDPAGASSSAPRLHRARILLWAGQTESAHATFEEAVGEGAVDQDPTWAPEVAYARSLRGDSAGAHRMLERAESSLGSAAGQLSPESDRFVALQIAAVRGEAGAATRALEKYVEGGGVRASRIARSPLFARVRQDPGFRSELDELEARIERMRQQVEELLEEP